MSIKSKILTGFQIIALFVSLDLFQISQLQAQTNSSNVVIPWESFDEHIYLTDNDRLLTTDPITKKSGFFASALREARKSSECRPATNDLAGNWGKSEAGFQMSLRFYQPVYTNNQPIVAVVILRNVSSQTQRWSMDWIPERFYFTVNGPNGRQATRKTESPSIITSGPSWITVSPKTQRRFEINLSEKFDLRTFGRYSIHVKTDVHGTNASPSAISSLFSDTATFEVVR